MTETEEMEALKRAYADIILNTAKEAAARVMAAELTARRMEQELNSSKEEAAGMLLRLKQMIDAKTKEAEISSLNQKQKYDELESQLNEAEGIILDLRVELNQAEEQLHEMKKKNHIEIQSEENVEEHSIKLTDACSGYELFTPSLDPVPEFSMVGRPSITYNTESDNITYNTESDNYYSVGENPVLDQIKDPELFRNGCTQRICATVTSLVQESCPVEEKLNPSKNSTDIEIVNAVGSKFVSEEKDQQEINETVSIVRRSHRKRKHKFWDGFMTACGQKVSHQIKKPRQAFPNLPCFRGKVKRCVRYGDDQAEDGTKIEDTNHEGVSKEIAHTEALPDDMELIDVLVKQDELASKFVLTSSSAIECGVEGGIGTEASNRSNVDVKRPCKYTFKRKLKKKKKKKRSMVYNRKWKKKSKI